MSDPEMGPVDEGGMYWITPWGAARVQKGRLVLLGGEEDEFREQLDGWYNAYPFKATCKWCGQPAILEDGPCELRPRGNR